MKLHASIADEAVAIEVRREGDRVMALVDGRRYEISFQRTPGSYLLVSDGAVFDCRVDGHPKSGEAVEVAVGTAQFSVTLTDPKRLRGSAGAAAHADEAARIIAPMPGKVVRVLVAAGNRVEAGDGILAVEAMKMQNEMKSPKAGTVTALNVEVGATVNGGDVLAVIE
jgi:biotin carboxyl carrier protein